MGFNICVQTSLWEGMPITVIEAMVAGIPVVVTDVVGNRDVVAPGESGFVAQDEDELAYYVEKLVKNPVLRQEMGRCAREIAIKRFSLDRLIKELVEIYHTAGEFQESRYPRESRG